MSAWHCFLGKEEKLLQWVFDLLVSWILENLTGCFSVISNMLFTFFNMKRNSFDTFFNFFGSDTGLGYSLFDIIRALGFALCMLIVIIRLLSNLLSTVTEEYEDPIKLAFRAIMAFIIVAVSPQIVDMEFDFMKVPYSSINKIMTAGMDKTGGMTSDTWVSFADLIQKELPGAGTLNKVTLNLLTIGCLIAIFSAFLKLALEVAERYVVICVSVYLAPLAFATVASKNTVRVMQAYFRMIFCQLLLMIFNVIFVDGTIIAIHNYTTSGGTVQFNTKQTMPVFIFCVLLLAFITAGQKIDSYMRSLGLDTVQTGSLLDEIRGGIAMGIAGVRSIGNAVHSAGNFANAVAGGVSMMRGHTAPGSSGNGHGGKTNPAKEAMANAGRTSAANWAHGMAQGNASMQSVGQKAAQRQIKSGAFNGLAGESNKAIWAATETAIGAAAMAKMGIDPQSLVGKNGMIDFKTQNGAKGTLSFEPKNGNGWHQLKDEQNNLMNAWVKGSDNLGISSAPTGTHQNLAGAFGADAGAMIAGKVNSTNLGQKLDPNSLEAVSLGNGEFALVGKTQALPGQEGQGMSMSLGRIVPAEVGASMPGAIMAENEFGGKVGFIPQTDAGEALNGKYVDNGQISLGNGLAAPSDSVYDALADKMDSNNIAKDTAMLGFESNGTVFTASFADPISGTKEISGNVSDLISNMDHEDFSVGLTDNMRAPADTVCGALEGAMAENGIAENASLLGFNSDGNSYTASFSDPDTGVKSISGNIGDLVGSMDQDSISIGLSDDKSTFMGTVHEALGGAMAENGIAESSVMTGFEYDNGSDKYKATFSDLNSSESRTITGNVSDLIDNISKDHTVMNSGVNDGEWIGMNNLFDTKAYSAMTGESPREITFNNMPTEEGGKVPYNFTITNESGSKYIVDQASSTGKYDKVIQGGKVLNSVPLSIQKMPKEKREGYDAGYDGQRGYGKQKRKPGGRR